MTKVCRSCNRHAFVYPEGSNTPKDLCTLDATRDPVTGAYPDAQPCEENRKPGRLCGPLGRKYSGLGW